MEKVKKKVTELFRPGDIVRQKTAVHAPFAIITDVKGEYLYHVHLNSGLTSEWCSVASDFVKISINDLPDKVKEYLRKNRLRLLLEFGINIKEIK